MSIRSRSSVTTKFSLSSHRKDIRLFLFIALCVFLFIVFIDVFFSVVLNRNLAQIRKIAAESGEFSFNYRRATFNLFKGVTVAGPEFDKGGEILFAAKRLDMGFDLFSLLQQKVLIKNIFITHPRLLFHKISDLISLSKEILEKMKTPIGFFETTHFKGTDLELGDVALLDIRGYFSSIKGNLLISRGEILLKKIRLPAASPMDFFRGSKFYKPFDYVFEAEPEGEDFVFSRFELSNPYLKFTGSGRIQNFALNPVMTLEMNFLNIILDDFPALNHEHVKSRGVVDSVLKVAGPLTGLKSWLSVKISNASFGFFDSLFLTKVNGSALFVRDRLIGRHLSLFINGIPFVADFAVYQESYPHILLQLSSLSKDVKASAFHLNLSADWVENELVGSARTKIRYLLKDTANTFNFSLKNFRLGYDDYPFIVAENLDTEFLVESLGTHADTKVFERDVSLEQLFCVIRRQKDEFVLDNLKSVCYAGTLEGKIHFLTLNEQLAIKGEAHVRDVDLNEFFQGSKGGSYVLLGRLDGDLRFDSRLTDMFKGQLFITNGLVEQNPLLNAVADFLGVVSLKKIAFDELSMFFSGGRGEYTSEAKLKSSQVSALLDTKISSYDKMDGYLTVSIATELLNESKQFKKILTYIRHGEPSVVFPFKIFSYIHSPRVLWLKNEFKEKLQNLLPERNKRFLQRQVTGMIEKMKTE